MNPLHRCIERATGTIFGTFQAPDPFTVVRPDLHIGKAGPVALGRLAWGDDVIGYTVCVGTRAVYLGRVRGSE